MLVRENVGKVAPFLSFYVRKLASFPHFPSRVNSFLVRFNNFVRHDVLISDTIVFTGGESECRKNKVA